MALSREEYSALVERLEDYAKANPTQYRARVRWLARLGQIYILVVLLVSLAFTVSVGYGLISGKINYVSIKLEIALVFIDFAILSALYVKIPEPDGFTLSPQTAPRLFAMLEDLRDKLDCDPISQVLLIPDFNAAAAQRSKYGIFGGTRNYVLVGMPMLQALSPEQLKAVMAHELGHLSGNHNRFDGKIYRTRAAWENLMHSFHQKGALSELIFGKFFNWYTPYFGAYSFVLLRQNEYEADRCAAELTTPEIASEALVRTELAAQYLGETYWREVYEGADKTPKPNVTPFSALGSAFREQMKPTDCERWLDRALLQRTDTADTHPALTDRLAALGTLPPRPRGQYDVAQRPPLPAEPPVTAAQYYFGDGMNTFLANLDAQWQTEIAPLWERRHQRANEGRARLAGLEHRAAHQLLTEEEKWERIELVQEFRTDAEAIPLLAQMLAEKPEEPQRLYALGVTLLREKIEGGIAHIEDAMTRDSRSILAGCDAICDFLMEVGRPGEAEVYRQRALKQYDLEVAGQEETERVTVKDNFLSPTLTREEVQTMSLPLLSHPKVKEAYLVRKQLKVFPDRSFYVIAWVPKLKWYQFSSSDDFSGENQELANSVPCSERCVFIVLNGSRRKLAKKIKAIPGAKIG